MSPPPPPWANDARIPFDPPPFTLARQALIEEALIQRCSIPRQTFTYRILEDFGNWCHHVRLEWHGYPVGTYEERVDLWNALAAISDQCPPLLAALATCQTVAVSLWKQLMLVPSSKCPQIEAIILDQSRFWTLVNALILIERAHKH